MVGKDFSIIGTNTLIGGFMKATGIVIEHNPFTNGHKIHIEKTKELTKSDVIVAVMSSSFVQRGEPSIISKENRVKLALAAGVDVVIELPFLYSVESSDYFCKYAIELLNNLKVRSICFGSETGDTKEFLDKYNKTNIVQPHLDFLVSDLMDEGLSYPKAMAKALAIIDAYKLETPNDILGLGYLKTIKNNNYPIEIYTYKRVNNYNDENISLDSISASGVRRLLKENQDISLYTPYSKEIETMEKYYIDDYYDFLKYKLMTSSSEELQTIHLVDEGIENLFKKNILLSNNIQEFIEMCISKRYTYARIKRTIIHILVNTKKEFAKKFLNSNISYIRLLGVSSKGQEYLNEIRKDISIPLLSKFRGKNFALLQFEKQVNHLYNASKPLPYAKEEYEKEHYIYPIRKSE